ncbi:hypothetical protein D3C87_351140 [compost metagenome]
MKKLDLNNNNGMGMNISSCGHFDKNVIIGGLRETINSCLREDELRAMCSLYLDEGAIKRDIVTGLNEIKLDGRFDTEIRQIIDNVIVTLQ